MKESKFSDAQKAFVLKQGGGRLCHRNGGAGLASLVP